MVSSDEKSIFLQALEETSEAAREAYLSLACGDDQQLKSSLKELLRVHALESPLDQPIAEMSSGKSHLLASTNLLNPQVGYQRIGTVIGPYKLMEQIGEGGFGLVHVR